MSTELDVESPVDVEPPAPKRRRVCWKDPVVARIVDIEQVLEVNYMLHPRDVRRRSMPLKPSGEECR